MPGTRTVSPSKNVFPNKLKQEQRNIALSIARLCHHAHPEIVQKIRVANEKEREKLAQILPTVVNITDYFHKGSACVFPGVRRFIGRLNKKELLKYIPGKGAIRQERYSLTLSSLIQKWCRLPEYGLCHVNLFRSDIYSENNNINFLTDFSPIT